MHRALLACAVAWVVASFAVACESVPDLRFDDLEGGSEGGRDGGSDAPGKDGGGTDGGGDGAVSCPQAAPSDAVGCCSSVPCIGKSCTQQCNKCDTLACGSGLYCCTAGAGSCVSPGTACN